MFSNYLKNNKEKAKELVNILSDSFDYVSILLTDVKNKIIRVTNKTTNISNSISQECGFVVKMNKGGAFFEYSKESMPDDIKALAKEILDSVKIDESLKKLEIKPNKIQEEKLIKDFVRESDFDLVDDNKKLSLLNELKNKLNGKEHVINVITMLNTLDVSKMFISKNKELSQYYTWSNMGLILIYNNNGKTVMPREFTYSNNILDCFKDTDILIENILKKAECLTKAKPIQPGVYDIITDYSITGLIAHEAFGHGVEMDQFVKDRAMAKYFINKDVASNIVNMHDGASAAFSTASYFFDDDGVLASDTQIIENGILKSGISDLVSATLLGTKPTGNGRRQSYKNKAYTRMTNTFISSGNAKLEDMIKSVKHGYMLFETNNGMEDPKNWNIQCTAEYGIEIVDGKLTDNYVSPVVMSGFVPDLLKSISMVSDGFLVIGSGSCGKGYKEWVRVSDGGANLKARCKLS